MRFFLYFPTLQDDVDTDALGGDCFFGRGADASNQGGLSKIDHALFLVRLVPHSDSVFEDETLI